MRIVRIIAGTFFLLAAIALVSDVTRSRQGAGYVVTSLAAHWRAASPTSLTAVQASVSRNLHPYVWDPLISRLLLLPAWFTLGAVGLLIAHLGRRKRRVNIFIN